MKLRECRDSPTHPDSLGIVFALDVTGSMGKIPDLLARTELAPGIAQYEYLLRLMVAGRYRVPAALARAQAGAQGSGNVQELSIGQP